MDRRSEQNTKLYWGRVWPKTSASKIANMETDISHVICFRNLRYIYAAI